MTRRRIAGSLGRALAALRGFLRGFLGLAGAGAGVPDASADGAAARTPTDVRDALAERAERRKGCC